MDESGDVQTNLDPVVSFPLLGMSNGPKKDTFYEAWDKFTTKRLVTSLPTLEQDVEGRPGRKVEKDEDGVVVRRYVRPSCDFACTRTLTSIVIAKMPVDPTTKQSKTARKKCRPSNASAAA